MATSTQCGAVTGEQYTEERSREEILEVEMLDKEGFWRPMSSSFDPRPSRSPLLTRLPLFFIAFAFLVFISSFTLLSGVRNGRSLGAVIEEGSVLAEVAGGRGQTGMGDLARRLKELAPGLVLQ